MFWCYYIKAIKLLQRQRTATVRSRVKADALTQSAPTSRGDNSHGLVKRCSDYFKRVDLVDV